LGVPIATETFSPRNGMARNPEISLKLSDCPLRKFGTNVVVRRTMTVHPNQVRPLLR
jgi:hypothetical protein